MNKKLIAASVAAVGIIAASALVPVAVFAASNTTSAAGTFVQMLASKLGLDEATVKTAVDSVKTDMQVQRQAQFKTDVAQAVTDGKLTQRQADILLAVQDVQSTMTPPTMSDRATRADHEQVLIDALNAKGLNTTLDEVTATSTAARTASLRSGFGGPGGPGVRGRGIGMM